MHTIEENNKIKSKLIILDVVKITHVICHVKCSWFLEKEMSKMTEFSYPLLYVYALSDIVSEQIKLARVF